MVFSQTVDTLRTASPSSSDDRWYTLVPGKNIHLSELISGFFGHMFYVTHRFETYRFNVVLWSLEVEAQFYLLAPLLALIYNI